jgi:hypothetical protein
MARFVPAGIRVLYVVKMDLPHYGIGGFGFPKCDPHSAFAAAIVIPGLPMPSSRRGTNGRPQNNEGLETWLTP